LDVAEVAMDLEDAFGVNFEESLPGDPSMETIGKVVDFLDQRINGRAKVAAGKKTDA
jgi:acyl carrier protein